MLGSLLSRLCVLCVCCFIFNVIAQAQPAPWTEPNVDLGAHAGVDHKKLNQPIDREALVRRHNITLDHAMPKAPLTVGNGRFAYSFDITGMQSLDDSQAGYVPRLTLSEWGWHQIHHVKQLRYEDTLVSYEVGDRQVTYSEKKNDAWQYFRENPHRYNLGRMGLVWINQDGTVAAIKHIENAQQTLDLWTGIAISQFELIDEDGRRYPVRVQTAVAPMQSIHHMEDGQGNQDVVGFEITSPLIASGRLGVQLGFSYPLMAWGPRADDWLKPEQHQTRWQKDKGGEDGDAGADADAGADGMVIDRLFDPNVPMNRRDYAGAYQVRVVSEQALDVFESKPHHLVYRLDAEASTKHLPRMSITFCFKPKATAYTSPTIDRSWPRDEQRQLKQLHTLSADQVMMQSAQAWPDFWLSGAAVDLSLSSDPRWKELERRIVLSQYVTAISSGYSPPQETGLVVNSWYGKPHLEMHYWHSAHWALWGRVDRLERQLGWYADILPAARSIAERQGYDGVRWPKMTSPLGMSAPSGVGEFLIWQQPHMIYLAELVYRQKPNQKTLFDYGNLVEQTAAFMADYARFDEKTQRYVLGPALIPAQENYSDIKADLLNPTYELAYWRWALQTAQAWRERQGLDRQAKWDLVLEQLSPLPDWTTDWTPVSSQVDASVDSKTLYPAIEHDPYTRAHDHPSMLMIMGVLPPTQAVDRQQMSRTYDWVKAVWDWPSTWGWDYPVMAMTAARLGRTDDAIDALLMDTPKNPHLINGQNFQADRLPVYLPGNGGLLAAVAMMAGGWDEFEGQENQAQQKTLGNAPGFPQDGSWVVRHEGLYVMP